MTTTHATRRVSKVSQHHWQSWATPQTTKFQRCVSPMRQKQNWATLPPSLAHLSSAYTWRAHRLQTHRPSRLQSGRQWCRPATCGQTRARRRPMMMHVNRGVGWHSRRRASASACVRGAPTGGGRRGRDRCAGRMVRMCGERTVRSTHRGWLRHYCHFLYENLLKLFIKLDQNFVIVFDESEAIIAVSSAPKRA